MRTLIAGVAVVATAGVLAGCTAGPSSTGTPTASAPSTVATATSPSGSATSSWSGEEAKIAAQVEAYSDFSNRVFADSGVPVNEAAKYLMDVSPDNVLTAVMQQIVQFRSDGYKQTGIGTTTVVSIEPNSDGTYQARTCDDSSHVVVTNAQREKVDTGPTNGAALNRLSKGVDGVWRISKIQGVGTC